MILKLFNTFKSLPSIIYVECASQLFNFLRLSSAFSMIGLVTEHIFKAINTSFKSNNNIKENGTTNILIDNNNYYNYYIFDPKNN